MSVNVEQRWCAQTDHEPGSVDALAVPCQAVDVATGLAPADDHEFQIHEPGEVHLQLGVTPPQCFTQINGDTPQ
jgi:hypothetical protein